MIRSRDKRHKGESGFVDFLIGCTSGGYAKSCKDVMALVQQIVSARDPKVVITIAVGGTHSVLPTVTLRHADPLSYARAAASGPNIINMYFDLMEDVIKVNGLSKSPGSIFNCDETAMPLSHKPPKVTTQVGQMHPSSAKSGDKSHINSPQKAYSFPFCPS